MGRPLPFRRHPWTSLSPTLASPPSLSLPRLRPRLLPPPSLLRPHNFPSLAPCPSLSPLSPRRPHLPPLLPLSPLPPLPRPYLSLPTPPSLPPLVPRHRRHGPTHPLPALYPLPGRRRHPRLGRPPTFFATGRDRLLLAEHDRMTSVPSPMDPRRSATAQTLG